jgi:uncharacterized protein YfaS (alpha-2-macroglobulin family)
VLVRNKSSQYLFYQLTEAGFDKNLPQDAVKEQLEVMREYRNAKGELVTKPIVGEQLKAVLRLRSFSKDCHCDHLAVVDLLPGGLEVDVTGLRSYFNTLKTKASEAAGASSGEWVPDYIDVREDRVIFFGFIDSEAKEFTYPVYAAYPGTFTNPPIYAEAMYNRKARAISGGAGKIVVEER